MKRIFLFLFTFIVPSLWAQQYETMKLWPDNPSAESEMYIYHPVKAVKSAPAILICPGGGYAGLSMDNEGHNMIGDKQFVHRQNQAKNTQRDGFEREEVWIGTDKEYVQCER